ncbi:MAG: SPOR domain-containing protein [Methylococcales bacterium]
MTKDYKYRSSRKEYRKKQAVPVWRWFVACALLGAFIVFLVYLGLPEPESESIQKKAAAIKIPIPSTPIKPEPKPAKESPKPEKPQSPNKPRFEFYTILPEQEVEIPETEIKIRKSEEKQGKAKPGNYVLQVGSFKTFKDADRLKAELAMLGIHSNIESTKIKDATWNRVKVGPFTSMVHVDAARKKLRLKHIDAIVVSAK